MNRTLALVMIATLFGGAIGFVLAAGNGVTFDGHDHGDTSQHAGMDHSMAHETPLEVSTANAPMVGVMIKPDPMSGHNLHVTTQNFTFAPQAASLAHVAGQGHAHVYINGKKHSRLYGPWLHFTDLPKGDVTVKVTLNSNDHRTFSVNGTDVSATTKLTNP